MRPETGSMKFGSDWSGTFIRGNDAFWYALHLEQYLKFTETLEHKDNDILMNIGVLMSLLDNLKSSNEIKDGFSVNQQLKDFNECR